MFLGTREPLHMPRIVAGDVILHPDYKSTEALAVPKALLWRATALAIESALRLGADFPVGATVSDGAEQMGGMFASDGRTGYKRLHAEDYALVRAKASGFASRLLGVTMEPCGKCQGSIAGSRVENCYFVLSRTQVEEKVAVNHHPSLLDGPEQTERPFYLQIEDPTLTAINLALLNSVTWEADASRVQVDRDTLLRDLSTFDEVVALRV